MLMMIMPIIRAKYILLRTNEDKVIIVIKYYTMKTNSSPYLLDQTRLTHLVIRPPKRHNVAGIYKQRIAVFAVRNHRQHLDANHMLHDI